VSVVWRAAKLADLTKYLLMFVMFEDADAVVIGVDRNIQREDLNPVEESVLAFTASWIEIFQPSRSKKWLICG